MFGLPNQGRCDVQVFLGNAAVGSDAFNNWREWVKPRGCSMVQIYALTGGMGGGSARSGAAASARGGGQGGTAGPMSSLLVMASLIPDSLHVRSGVGGIGGPSPAANTNGVQASFGSRSVVSIVSGSITAANVLLTSDNGQPVNTAGGGTSTGGGANTSTIPNAASSSTMILSGLGMFTSRIGQVGGNGGAHTGAVGASVTALAVCNVTGGAGGAGCGTDTLAYAGGAITGAGIINTVSGGAAGGGHGSSWGQLNGMTSMGTGGSGGGSADNAAGGNGGNGWYGCGGGGGGAGTTGGRGGNGGPGLVIIISW